MTSSTSLIISGSSADVGSSNSIAVGIERQCAGDGDPLLLAAGEVDRVGFGFLGEADAGEQLARRARCASLRDRFNACTCASITFSSAVMCG